MKQLITFIITFALVYLVSMLLDFDFIARSHIRIGITVLLMICIILAGASKIKEFNNQ